MISLILASRNCVLKPHDKSRGDLVFHIKGLYDNLWQIFCERVVWFLQDFKLYLDQFLLTSQLFSTLFNKKPDQSQANSPWAEMLFPEVFLLQYIVAVLRQSLGKLKTKKKPNHNQTLFIICN